MTKENLKIANDLIPKIENVKKGIDKWKTVTHFGGDIDAVFAGGSTRRWLPTEHIPLDILKVIVLDKYEKELRDLELQFQKL